MPANTYVLYHHHCDDGFGAAYAAWKALGAGASYVPVLHGEPPPDMPSGSRVVIVDFAYPRDTLVDMAQRMASVQVLDHHKTAQEDLVGLPFAHLDMTKSGAVLSWEYWHPNEPLPELLRYVEDRDLWRFALPNTHEVTAALETYARDFDLWDRLSIPALAEEGRPILRFIRQNVSRMAERARFQDIAGYSVPVVNASLFTSDVLDELAHRFPTAPFAASYFDRGDGKRQWGLASVGSFDVSRIAKQFGGGGHKNRSGFVEEQ